MTIVSCEIYLLLLSSAPSQTKTHNSDTSEITIIFYNDNIYSQKSPFDLLAGLLLDPAVDGAQHLHHLTCSELCRTCVLPCLVLPADSDSMGLGSVSPLPRARLGVPRKLEWEGAVEGCHTQGAGLPLLLSTTNTMYYSILQLYPTFPSY